MKHIHKHFPPQFAQMVVIDSNTNDETLTSLLKSKKVESKNYPITKFNGSDYNLFMWLIYNTHLIYSNDDKKPTTFKFRYIDVRKTLKSFDTQSIQKSIERLNEVAFILNYCKSYDDKDYVFVKPFEIEIIESDRLRSGTNVSYGFKVQTSTEFLSWFDNPKPLVDVNYSIIYKLSKMSKFLYLFLRDAYGAYQNTVRYRKIDIKRFKHMMNIHNSEMSNSEFVSELKKSIKEINKYTDLTIEKLIPIKEMDFKSGAEEIIEIKFEMMMDTSKMFTLKSKNSRKKQQEQLTDNSSENKVIESDVTDTIDDVESDTDTVAEYSFEDYLEDSVEITVQSNINDGITIRNPIAYRKTIRENLLKDGIEDEFEFKCIIENEKNILRKSIKDNQPYEIYLTDGDNPYRKFSIDENCLFINIQTKQPETQSIRESIQFIDDNRGDLYFDKLQCSDIYKIGRL